MDNDINKIYKMLNWHSNFGVSVYGIPLSAGADINIIPYSENLRKGYFGGTTSLGFGTPGGECHVEWGVAETVEKINIYDMAEKIYEKIMEW